MSEYKVGKRDIELQDTFYTRHVMAMTTEGLHGKSDIAAELAARDMRIAELEQERDNLKIALAMWVED
jgi:hypothetical protein